MPKPEHIVDAKGRTLGRVASEAAKILAGKTSPAYVRNKAPNLVVKIVNAKSIHIPEKKHVQKLHIRYTGYPGGLKKARLEEVITKKGIAEPVRLAVYGMLPANKLRPVIMKNLKIEE